MNSAAFRLLNEEEKRIPQKLLKRKKLGKNNPEMFAGHVEVAFAHNGHRTEAVIKAGNSLFIGSSRRCWRDKPVNMTGERLALKRAFKANPIELTAVVISQISEP